MSRILAIGIATVDIINEVAEYPAEDSEVRALGQRIARGGNATNTLAVLSQLGHSCSWGGVLAEDADSAHILADLAAHRIDLGHCRRLPRGRNPTSYILISRANGSRSIVHYRDLPEFGHADFASVDPAGFDWLHFEGRNVAETLLMLQRVRRCAPQPPISVEIEKPRPGIELLLPWADLLLFSRAYAAARGCPDAESLFAEVRAQAPQADLVCGWGADGAWACGRDGRMYMSAAVAPPRVVDTLGAGDTFTAACIDARLRGAGLADMLKAACRLAGRKCGQLGFAGLGREPGDA
ncbi:MAG TPA: PfkB family carbohydrate kinase [Gammaproteobacteria bacterium]